MWLEVVDVVSYKFVFRSLNLVLEKFISFYASSGFLPILRL
ncbi:hypothetical protein EMUCRT_0614 [Ehrlichia cf. muris str. EmCRT]|uniref:Uncharacterized protein n=1 Tax=Ehrlichia cf. muris str. EmCRT TaxID=1359167 RepID=A0A0F3NFK0_9RICK|nr:hypothetical protein EMUCRT_0614 [Ehrlichia cf. muris str. EmCRT]